MASTSGSGEEYPTLSAQFDQYLKLFEEIDNSDLPTNSEELQKKVKEGRDCLEKTTFMVSQIGLFSDNEVVEELPTSSLKFLLLPYLLGGLMLKQVSIPRAEALKLSKVYYIDFLKRCKEYDLTSIHLDPYINTEDDSHQSNNVPVKKPTPPTAQELRDMAKQREDKIKKYREKKSIEESLAQLRIKIEKNNTSEDTLREYYLTLLKKSIHHSIEELDNIVTEETMLKQVAKMKKEGTYPPPESTQSSGASFKPFLLTKDKIQREVFGLGYPSLPQMSVQEFYDQRVRDGWFPGPGSNNSSGCCSKPSDGNHTHCESETKDPVSENKEEVDDDDPNELARLRERDEWRDTHRTGWGNTYNRS